MSEHKLYRLARTIDDPLLRGKPVVFRCYIERSWDIRRALVALVNDDGSSGEEWLVDPVFVINL